MISGFIVKSTSKSKVYRPTRAYRGSRGIALSFLDLGARRGGWSAPRPGRFTPEKYPVPIVQEAGWAPGPVWTCAKNLVPTGIRSPDRPARSQSLYRLSYRGPPGVIRVTLFCIYSLCIAPWIFRYSKHSNSIKDIENHIYGVFSYIRKILLAVYSMRVGRLYVVMLQNGLVYLSCLRLM
jgi:hypothetical protein